MNIKQALKYKNKLTQKINETFAKIKIYNSVEDGQTRPYDVNVLLNEYFEMSTELVELKTKIHIANQTVYNKIFELSELKSQVSKLKDLDCGEGKVRDRYRITEEVSNKTAVISVVSRDVMVESLETKIESLQDDLDVHNNTVHI